MAEPLRKDPDQQLNPPPNRQFNVHRYGDPNRGSRHWWFWILVVAVIVWFAVWGHGGKHAQQEPTPVAVPQTPVAPAGPAMDVASMLSQQNNYIGKPIHLRDVLVQSANDNASIFVGPTKDQQILVVLKKGSVPDTLKGQTSSIPSGGIVTIDGTAQKPPSARDLARSAKISRKEAEQVVKDGIVIEADTAVPQTM